MEPLPFNWSLELSAKVAVLRNMLFREDPSLCIGLFDTDETATAIKCICKSDNAMYSLSVFLSLYCLHFVLYPLYNQIIKKINK